MSFKHNERSINTHTDIYDQALKTLIALGIIGFARLILEVCGTQNVAIFDSTVLVN